MKKSKSYKHVIREVDISYYTTVKVMGLLFGFIGILSANQSWIGYEMAIKTGC